MMPESLEGSIQHAAQLITSARHVVVFTGAGISTHSGIPDFRSQGSGLWQRDDPMVVASLTTFRRHPQRFFNWLRPLASSMWKADPNAAHVALALLENKGKVSALITQNIDGLHQRAGSSNVLEVHGSMETLTCPACRKTYSGMNFAISFIEEGILPRCAECQSILKPDIVLFEEMLPLEPWQRAENHCRRADLMLVVGSSLKVEPAGHLPDLARENGARLIIVNFTSTYLDEAAEVVLHEDLVKVVPLIVEGVK